MCDRKNTLVCSFDPASSRLTAFEIHEWIYDQLQVTVQFVLMIQIDGTRRQVFIKFIAPTFIDEILNETSRTSECKHTTGEISTVRLEAAGMWTLSIRLVYLPP
jgi:hypothetical protein